MGMVTNWLEPNGVVMSQGMTVRKSALSTVIDRHHRIGIDDIFAADVAALQGGQQFAVVTHIGLRQHPLLVLERGQADGAVADPRPVSPPTQTQTQTAARRAGPAASSHRSASRWRSRGGRRGSPAKAESCASYIETRALGKVILN